MIYVENNWDYRQGPDIRENNSELLHYDNPDFQVFCRRNHNPALAVFPGMRSHWHDDLEFIYVTKGHCSYLVNGEYVKLNEGEGIFVNARQMHLIICEEIDHWLECIIFHPIVLCSTKLYAEKYVSPILTNDSIPYVHLSDQIDWQKNILLAQTKLYELSLKKDSESEMMSTLFYMWDQLYQNVEKKSDKDHYMDRNLLSVKSMITFIHENFAEQISLDDICRHAGIGKTVCTKIFKEYANVTPIEYLRNYRIDRSRMLLCDTDLSISRIAYEVGFQGGSFFTETFKKKMGCTPYEFRKLFLEQTRK